MQVRFLLGPAGSGKTHRCLEELRTLLKKEPDGAPLVFLAPKQATFQLERQLLADPELGGYSRLHILSFERLAGFVYDRLDRPWPALLNEEGRVMVLRALLAARQGDLRIFRASSRLPGFALQLSGVLRELQQHQLDPTRLESLAGRVGSGHRLDDKLHDLALLLRAYLDWVRAHGLEDGDRILDLAAESLQAVGKAGSGLDIEGLWLDGFARMTPQERRLLLALLPSCRQATLAFCLEDEPGADPAWYSPWVLLGQTYRQCRSEVEALGERGVEARVEILPRRPGRNRFADNPVLQHLESHWARPEPMEEAVTGPPSAVRVLACAHPEQEAEAVAREIRRYVRGGGRFRDVAVLVRQLEVYHDVVRRVLTRYEIPIFLDRRERVAHHPLAELTRSALRVIAFQWRHEDWFAALKSGLVREPEWILDRLENDALEHGWEGAAWHAPLRMPGQPEREAAWNELRPRLLGPFYRMSKASGPAPTGPELAEALRGFWEDLKVGRTLEEWTREETFSVAGSASSRSVHGTVWDQMQAWLDNLALAFPGEAMSLAEWLPVLNAGLEGLTVGVIPPVLDQVLVGAIDRSRNPDLKRVYLLGVNETVFPAVPRAHLLLTEADRQQMEDAGHALSPGPRLQLGHERFYGYIACTRAREQVVLTYAREDGNGRVLNPSAFLGHLQRLFPWLEEEVMTGDRAWADAEHACELVGPLLRDQSLPPASRHPDLSALADHPLFGGLLDRMHHLHPANQEVHLAPGLAEALYGPQLRTSVSRIEEFADCPFRFFLSSGLRIEERKTFELDIRQQGSFQHEVLAQFHREVAEAGRRWRDLPPQEAREWVGGIADRLAASFENGMMLADGHNRFLAETYKLSLQRLVGVLVEWMHQYELDPAVVEIGFGTAGETGLVLPAWELDLGEGHRLALRGRIDRVDVRVDPASDSALCVVMDYKSSSRKPDRTFLLNGIEQQLPAYLNVLRHVPEPRAVFGAGRLVPAGVFYVPLKGAYESVDNRREALRAAEGADRAAFRHQGLFDVAHVRQLDNRDDVATGDQFPYRLTRSGEPHGNSFCALPSGEFQRVLDEQCQVLVEFGRRLYRGDVAIDPWKKGREKACDYCEFQSVCRIDPWQHAYRSLRTPEKRSAGVSGGVSKKGSRKRKGAGT